MDKKVFLEKLFAYVKTSINDVTKMSPEDQARWVEEVKKYYRRKGHPLEFLG